MPSRQTCLLPLVNAVMAGCVSAQLLQKLQVALHDCLADMRGLLLGFLSLPRKGRRLPVAVKLVQVNLSQLLACAQAFAQVLDRRQLQRL